jgi:hypothetical protein
VDEWLAEKQKLRPVGAWCHAAFFSVEQQRGAGNDFITHYTQSSVLRNTETASTHQSVSYLNAFPRQVRPINAKAPLLSVSGGIAWNCCVSWL